LLFLDDFDEIMMEEKQTMLLPVISKQELILHYIGKFEKEGLINGRFGQFCFRN
jgi:hypothetical protein